MTNSITSGCIKKVCPIEKKKDYDNIFVENIWKMINLIFIMKRDNWIKIMWEAN